MQEFIRKLRQCDTRQGDRPSESIEVETSAAPLMPSTHEILFEIERHPMTMSHKMLLLIFMADLADSEGRVPLRLLAEKFQEFFVDRSMKNKLEENPRRRQGVLSQRTLSEWERTIRGQPVKYLTKSFMIEEGTAIRWAPRIWTQMERRTEA